MHGARCGGRRRRANARGRTCRSTTEMSQVSRPMQIALAATLLLAAVWFVALRPKGSNAGAPAAAVAPAAPATSGAAPGVAGLKRAIDKAHGAVTTASGDAERAAQSNAGGAQPPAALSAPAKPA